MKANEAYTLYENFISNNFKKKDKVTKKSKINKRKQS